MSWRIDSVIAALLAATCVLSATSSFAAGPKSVSMKGTATVLKPVAVTTVTNLSSGNVKTQGNNPSGTVTLPATFPLFASPAPSYTGGWAKNGANADPGTAARVDLTGTAFESFTLNLTGWVKVSGDTPTMSAPTYYSPSNSPTTQAKGVFNAQGKATIYIGATFTIPRDNNGTTVIMRPQYTVNYN